MTDQDRISAIEKKLENSGRKDGWDKVSALGSLLIPVAIFGVGLVYSNRTAAADEEIARINAGVQQAQLLLQAVAPLAGADDRQKRLLAIQAVRLALRERGREIIEQVSRTDSDPQVRTAAVEVTNPNIMQLYSGNRQERLDAFADLLATRGNDATLPPLLIEVGRNALQNPDTPGRSSGIFNTLALLGNMEPAALAPHAAELRSFAEQARPMGPTTAGRANQLISRLPRPSAPPA